ncbi:hypothetical protein ABFA07_015583 [Porites harrisoni]
MSSSEKVVPQSKIAYHPVVDLSDRKESPSMTSENRCYFPAAFALVEKATKPGLFMKNATHNTGHYVV